MFQRCLLALAIMIGTAASLHAQPSCVWGSFDSTRVNYVGGVLTTGANHSLLRNIITSNGGTLGAATPTLTPAYLSGVDVFYTSLLSTNTGTLSAAEQAALQGWIAGGGTLIVTADIFPLAAYDSFTQFYGVTNYQAITGVGTGSIVAAHMITAGVTSFNYNTESTYTFGSDALLLGKNAGGMSYSIVMELGTGFNAGGRILVFGDHNMFTDSIITQADNSTLAKNMTVWSCVPEPSALALLILGAAAIRRRA